MGVSTSRARRGTRRIPALNARQSGCVGLAHGVEGAWRRHAMSTPLAGVAALRRGRGAASIAAVRRRGTGWRRPRRGRRDALPLHALLGHRGLAVAWPCPRVLTTVEPGAGVASRPGRCRGGGATRAWPVWSAWCRTARAGSGVAAGARARCGAARACWRAAARRGARAWRRASTAPLAPAVGAAVSSPAGLPGSERAAPPVAPAAAPLQVDGAAAAVEPEAGRAVRADRDDDGERDQRADGHEQRQQRAGEQRSAGKMCGWCRTS